LTGFLRLLLSLHLVEPQQINAKRTPLTSWPFLPSNKASFCDKLSNLSRVLFDYLTDSVSAINHVILWFD